MSLPNNKKIVILGGGTNTYISNHLALSAPAYGNTAISLAKKFKQHSENKMDVQLILTKMASSGTDATDIRQQLKDCNNEISELTSIPNRTAAEKRLLQSRYPYKARLETYLGSFEGSNPDTPEDIEIIVDKLVADPDTRVIIFNVAMVDFKPKAVFDLFNYEDSALNMTEFGKYKARIESRAIKGKAFIQITPYQKIINKIRKERKDILLVGFKTTCGATGFINDGQDKLSFTERNTDDWLRQANISEVDSWQLPSKGRILLFPHQVCHTVFPLLEDEKRIIIRFDLFFRAMR